MTIQKEIQEILEDWADDGCMFPNRSCNALGSGYCSSGDEAYKCLMERLASKGVVIKAQGISDDLAQTASSGEVYSAYGGGIALISTSKTVGIFRAFKEMGYTAVEPLVGKVLGEGTLSKDPYSLD